MSSILDRHIKAYEGNNLYDFDNSILLNWYPKRIVELATGARSLLELGVGHGYSTPLFADAFSRHVVLEGSPAVIAQASARLPTCRSEIVENVLRAIPARGKVRRHRDGIRARARR